MNINNYKYPSIKTIKCLIGKFYLEILSDICYKEDCLELVLKDGLCFEINKHQIIKINKEQIQNLSNIELSSLLVKKLSSVKTEIFEFNQKSQFKLVGSFDENFCDQIKAALNADVREFSLKPGLAQSCCNVLLSNSKVALIELARFCQESKSVKYLSITTI